MFVLVKTHFWERKFLSQYTGTPESIKKTNNKLKIVALGNIVIPIGLQILQGFAINLYIKHHELHLRSVMGRSPTLFIYMLLLGALFEMGLLFYVLQVRVIEPRLSEIPFTKKELPLDLFQRNVLTISFGVMGCMFLILVTLNPQNLDAGSVRIYERLSPILVYSLIYFIVVNTLLTSDIKDCIKIIYIISFVY